MSLRRKTVRSSLCLIVVFVPHETFGRSDIFPRKRTRRVRRTMRSETCASIKKSVSPGPRRESKRSNVEKTLTAGNPSQRGVSKNPTQKCAISTHWNIVFFFFFPIVQRTRFDGRFSPLQYCRWPSEQYTHGRKIRIFSFSDSARSFSIPARTNEFVGMKSFRDFLFYFFSFIITLAPKNDGNRSRGRNVRDAVVIIIIVGAHCE